MRRRLHAAVLAAGLAVVATAASRAQSVPPPRQPTAAEQAEKRRQAEEALSQVTTGGTAAGEALRFVTRDRWGRAVAHSASTALERVDQSVALGTAGVGVYKLFRGDETGNLLLRDGAAEVAHGLGALGLGKLGDVVVDGFGAAIARQGGMALGRANAAAWGAFTAGSYAGEALNELSRDWTSDGRSWNDVVTDRAYDAYRATHDALYPEEDPDSAAFDRRWTERANAARAHFGEAQAAHQEAYQFDLEQQYLQQQQAAAAAAAFDPWALAAVLAGLPPGGATPTSGKPQYEACAEGEPDCQCIQRAPAPHLDSTCSGPSCAISENRPDTPCLQWGREIRTCGPGATSCP